MDTHTKTWLFHIKRESFITNPSRSDVDHSRIEVDLIIMKLEAIQVNFVFSEKDGSLSTKLIYSTFFSSICIPRTSFTFISSSHECNEAIPYIRRTKWFLQYVYGLQIQWFGFIKFLLNSVQLRLKQLTENSNF